MLLELSLGGGARPRLESFRALRLAFPIIKLFLFRLLHRQIGIWERLFRSGFVIVFTAVIADPVRLEKLVILFRLCLA